MAGVPTGRTATVRDPSQSGSRDKGTALGWGGGGGKKICWPRCLPLGVTVRMALPGLLLILLTFETSYLKNLSDKFSARPLPRAPPPLAFAPCVLQICQSNRSSKYDDVIDTALAK